MSQYRENPADSLAPLLAQSLTLTSQPKKGRRAPGSKIIYAKGAVALWWPVGAPAGEDPIPASFGLKPIACDPVEVKTGVKPLVLARGENSIAGESGGFDGRLWGMIRDRLEPDLLPSVLRARGDKGSAAEETKLSFFARIGKVQFDGGVCLDSIRRDAVSEAASRKRVPKSFYTGIHNAYMENIEHKVVPKIGFHFEVEKENYHVKVFDKSRNVIISCKCMVVRDGSVLEIHKMELTHVRHLVVDLSCLYKDLDIRLMLVKKRILKSLDDEQKVGIAKLIKSAIFDPAVKGGLRWPLVEDSGSERFSIVGAWHTKYKAFRGPAMRLKLKHAERFDHKTSIGIASHEVTLKLTGISEKLGEGDLERDNLMQMVQEAMKLMWDHFLSYNVQLP